MAALTGALHGFDRAAKPDPVDFEQWAGVSSHRHQRDPAQEAQHERKFQIVQRARARDMRVLLSLRSQTALMGKGTTTENKVEHAMRQRAGEAAHEAAERHLQQLKRRLAQHAAKWFAVADRDDSGEVDWDEWVAAFGAESSTNPLWDAGAIDVSILRRLFDELDVDKNGTVSIYEFVTGVLQQDKPETKVDVSKLLVKKQPVAAVKPPSPGPLESPLTRYRMRNRPPAYEINDLRKISNEYRSFPHMKIREEESAGEGKATSFLGDIGLDTGAMEREEVSAQIRQVFELFDDDESGFLDLPEVKQGLERFGIALPDQSLIDLIQKVGGGADMQCSKEQFEKLLSLVPGQSSDQVPQPPKPPSRQPEGPPRPRAHTPGSASQGNASKSAFSRVPSVDSNAKKSSDERGVADDRAHAGTVSVTTDSDLSGRGMIESSSSSSSSEYDDADERSGSGLISRQHLSQHLSRQHIRSPTTTNRVHDDALQSHLKELEQNLKQVIHSSKLAKQDAFDSDIQTGKLAYIAAEIQHEGALYSGPVNTAGVPEGTGAIDYQKVGDVRGRLTAERRSYYVGTLVAGKRQGFGLLRWMDKTEYCGTWENDMPCGSGVETYEDGSWYAGGFKDDKRHGMGGIWTADGHVYIGQWQKGERHGAGVIGHANTVNIDVKGNGKVETVKLEMDMVEMKMKALYNPLSKHAMQIKAQIVQSIFKLRFSRQAANTMHPVFIAEFDRGVRLRSMFYNNRVVEHQGLLQDAVYAVTAAQANGMEALEHSREGWLVLKHAQGANIVRERRGKQQILMNMKMEDGSLDKDNVNEDPEERPHQTEREVGDEGLLIDTLEVKRVRAEQLTPKRLILCLSVICARDLEAMDIGGSSDPYVIMALGDYKLRSNVIKKNLNPKWDQNFELIVYDWSVPLQVSVWDNDALSADDVIGETEVWLEDILEDIRVNRHKDFHSKALLRVTIIRAKNLIAADRGGTSDPYIRVHIGSNPVPGPWCQKTEVKQKTLNPEWNESFEFKIGSNDRREIMIFECFDSDAIGSDDSLGKFCIRLESLPLLDPDQPGHPATHWHEFEKEGRLVNDGMVELRYQLFRDDIVRMPPQVTPLNELDLNGDGQVDDEALLKYVDGLKGRVEVSVSCVRVEGVMLHHDQGTKMHEDINGEYHRSKENCNGRRVYMKDGKTGIAMWWGLMNGQMSWCVGPTEDVGSSRVWAFVNSLGIGPQEAGRRGWHVYSNATQSFEMQSDVRVVGVDEEIQAEEGIADGNARVEGLLREQLDGEFKDARAKYLELEKSTAEIIRLVGDQTRPPASEDFAALDVYSKAAVLSAFAEEQQAVMLENMPTDEVAELLKALEHCESNREMSPIRTLERARQNMIKLYHKTAPKSVQWFSVVRDHKIRGEIQLGFSFLEMGDPMAVADFRVDRSHSLTTVASSTRNPSWKDGPMLMVVDSEWSRLRCTLLHQDPAAEKKHVLVICIHRARKLKAMDSAFFGKGSSDPYVVVRFGEEQRKTAIISQNLNPCWEEIFTIPIFGDLKKKQVLVVNVYRARQLKAMDSAMFGKSSSDPYVIIKFEGHTKKTAIVMKDLNPNWNEKISIPIDLEDLPKDSRLHISVWDYDAMSTDDMIGALTIPVSSSLRTPVRDWFAITDESEVEATGELELEIQIQDPLMHVSVWDHDAMSADDVIGEVTIPIGEHLWTPAKKWFDITSAGQTTGQLQLGLGIQAPAANDYKPIAVIKLIGARDLEAMDLGGSSDPYAILKLGNLQHKTTIIENNLNPVWNEEFELPVENIHQPLLIEVFDHDKIGSDDMIGMARVPISDLPGRQKSQQWHALKLNGRTHGEILLSVFLTEQSIQSKADYLGEAAIKIGDLGHSNRTHTISMELGNGLMMSDRIDRRLNLIKRVLYRWFWVHIDDDDHASRAHNVLKQWHMLTHHFHVHGKHGVRFALTDGLRASSHKCRGIITKASQGKVSFEARAFSSLAQHKSILSNPARMPLSQKAISKADALRKYQGNIATLQKKLSHFRTEEAVARANEIQTRKSLDAAELLVKKLQREADDGEPEGARLMQEAAARGGLQPSDVIYGQWQIDQQRRRTRQSDADKLERGKRILWEAANEALDTITKERKSAERDEAYLLGHNPVDILDMEDGAMEAAIGILQVSVICAQRMRIPGSSSITEMPCWVRLSIGDQWIETSVQIGRPSFLWNEAFRMQVKKGSHHLKAEVLCQTPLPDESEDPATLLVTVHRARNLIAADRGGTSDPYFRLHVGDAVKECKRTRVIKKTLHPEFNETFRFRLSGWQRKEDLTIECFDHDLLSSDDSLGTCSLALEPLVFDKECISWFKLDGGGAAGDSANSGEVELRYTLLPDLAPANLEITILGAKDLMAADRGGTSDPYVRMTIGNALSTAKKTRVAKKTLNPTFDQSFSFALSAEKRRETLTVECLDEDIVGADDSLGSFNIRIDSLNVEEEYSGWYSLAEEGDEENKGRLQVKYRLVVNKQSLRQGTTSLGSCQIALNQLEHEGVEDLRWWTVGTGGCSRGRLMVNIEEAKDLNSNHGQPTCCVWLRLGKHSVKTLTSYNTCNPKWNCEPFAFDLQDEIQTITVDVLRKSGSKGDAGFLGRAYVHVDDLLQKIQSNGIFDEWLPLQERFDHMNDLVNGSVRISATFDSASSPSWGQVKLLLNYEHHKRVLLDQERDPEEERLMRLIAKATEDGHIDEDEQKELEEAEEQLANFQEKKNHVATTKKCGSAQVTVYEIRNSLISHVRALRGRIEIDGKTVAQTDLSLDIKQAVWDEVFVVDIPLYSQFVKIAATGQIMVLCLKVIMGKDLDAMDISGTSDPYVKIQVGSDRKAKEIGKTKIIYKNLDPEWDEDFEIEMPDMAIPLRISVWDNDLLGADDLIGETFIRLDEFMDANPVEDGGIVSEWFTIKRDHKSTGDIQLGFSFKAPNCESPVQSEKELGAVTIDVSQMAVGSEDTCWHRLTSGPEHYTLSVAALQAVEIMPVDGVTADPFVKFSVGSQTFQTAHIKQNCNPVWRNERYTFRIKSLNDVLRCEVFDYNQYSSHQFIGEYCLQMKDLFLNEEVEYWHELSLRPNQKDFVAKRHREGERLGEIKLKTLLRKTKVPACEMKLGMKLLSQPPVKKPNRNQNMIDRRKDRGIGTLEFTVVSASKMQGFDRSRPWIEARVGNEMKLTRRARGGDHPCWDSAFAVPVSPGSKALTCKILTMGLKKDRNRKFLLGETTVFLDKIQDMGLVDAWFRLDGRNRLGKLVLRIVSAENLLAADSNGKSDPFAEVRVGKQQQKTSTKMRTLDPVWDEEFVFSIWSVQDKVDIGVFDWDAVGNNDLLGRITIELADFFVMQDTPGEGNFKFSEKCELEGLSGTKFVDPEQTEPVQGSIKIEMSFIADPGLIEKVGRLRLSMDYVCVAKSKKEAAEMEMGLIEGVVDDADYDPWDDTPFKNVESGLVKALGPFPTSCLSKAKLQQSSSKFSLNLPDSSLDAQMQIFKSQGGQVASAKQLAAVRTATSSRPPTTVLGPGSKALNKSADIALSSSNVSNKGQAPWSKDPHQSSFYRGGTLKRAGKRWATFIAPPSKEGTEQVITNSLSIFSSFRKSQDVPERK